MGSLLLQDWHLRGGTLRFMSAQKNLGERRHQVQEYLQILLLIWVLPATRLVL
ncbi:hypothetical protein CLAC_09285 [Corynebacterium lactis RW2-5]|uniref:Uncharacterized protein n=1 Tax=Corynebacterium lactis RW2-5 TaxID=1408189 RepID=A0A0K2H3L4_9CORY|nr:hypothetical protein CLAC_09285 [Corynebacterium lactis RW2-5]